MRTAWLWRGVAGSGVAQRPLLLAMLCWEEVCSLELLAQSLGAKEESTDLAE